MKISKVIAGMAVASIAVAVLVGCGNSSSSSSSKGVKEITVWAWDDTYNVPAVKEAAKLWANKDVKVKVVSMSQDQVVQKLNTSLASGNKSGLPNIVLTEDYRIQGYLKSYPDAFSDLTSIVKKDNFAKYKFAVNTIGNKIYGVPFDSGVTGWFYRTDILKEAGYTTEQLNNMNWDQFIQVAKDVKAKTGKGIIAIDPSDLGLIRTIMQESGSWYTGSNGKKVTIENNKALKYGLELEASLYKQGLVDKISGWTAGQEAVQTGKVASAVMGSWYSSTITAAKDQSGKWAIAPTPALPESLGGVSGKIYASNSGGAGWYVLKGNGEAQAKDFLKDTFASNTDLMATLATKIGLVSTMKSAAETKVYKTPNEFYSGQQTLKDFSEWSQIIPPVNYGNQTYAIESTMTGALQEVVNGKNVDSVLKDYQKQVEAQLANNK